MLYDGYEIHTGFLSGNLFPSHPPEDRPVDEDESARRYAEMCKLALREAFPGAEIHARYQLHTSGALPLPLRTYVLTPDGERYEPGDGGPADEVEDICQRVWESWEWVVYT